ncbi:16S rRNA pseudouridine(516) synthase [Isobaculum melis]|uniref:Pseudouridine synthase n=1 Tax=Isobaculum melis TaxID=142588 RepID=A0A1H9TKI8_9LACT|nr:16S rRNA pseudouridine(516) synthase [Isobaculum melis]SER97612.1 16S rRNA pseudouridine516 synthase [Isobaculum melis]
MRLDKLLEAKGYGSRKKVKQLIKRKQVLIDGQVILADGYAVDPEFQQVIVAGERLTDETHVYYLLNKPAGVVSAVSDDKNQTVIDLIAATDQRPGLFPVGRLDRDTEGLLLITNNGQLAHTLLVPGKEVIKCYEAVVNEEVTAEDVLAFEKGIVFHGGIQCKPAKLTILSAAPHQSSVRLEISEGKFHQVKKMFLSVGKKVIYLKRISMGSLVLDPTLELGTYRPLTKEEFLLLTDGRKD